MSLIQVSDKVLVITIYFIVFLFRNFVNPPATGLLRSTRNDNSRQTYHLSLKTIAHYSFVYKPTRKDAPPPQQSKRWHHWNTVRLAVLSWDSLAEGRWLTAAKVSRIPPDRRYTRRRSGDEMSCAIFCQTFFIVCK
jgi:hypothetical protein